MSNSLSKKQIQEQLRLLNTIIGRKQATPKIKMPDGKKIRSGENAKELTDLAKKRSELIEQLNAKELVHKRLKSKREREERELLEVRRNCRFLKQGNNFRPNRGAHKTERGFMNYKYNYVFGPRLANLLLNFN